MSTRTVHLPVHANADLLPVRMCSKAVYCSRSFHIEHVQGLFVESDDTVEGQAQHDRAAKKGTRRSKAGRDADGDSAASAAESMPPGHSGSATGAALEQLPAPGMARVELSAVPVQRTLSSDEWGISGKVDWVEHAGGRCTVIEAKHGSGPKHEQHSWGQHLLEYEAWPADIAQLALYIALLREHGLDCNDGEILYRESGMRTAIRWTPEIEAFARDVVAHARKVAAMDQAPPPLVDSPKCPRCSLYDICLPDEHNALLAEQANAAPDEVRRIVAGRDDGTIVHVTSPGAYVRKDGEAIGVERRDGSKERVLTKDISAVALFGAVQVSQQCMTHLLGQGITIAHHTSAGEVIGITTPLATRNIGLRRAQFRAADDQERCLAASRSYVLAKIRNQRTVLKRYRQGLAKARYEDIGELPDWAATQDADVGYERGALEASGAALARMKIALSAAARCDTIDELRGHEGDAAASYFGAFKYVLPRPWQEHLSGRSRRPPRDRVNAMLSFGYALLVRECTSAISRVGLDPMLGLYHTMIPGRPALALDLMEPFRAAWVDTAILRLVATDGISLDDFTVSEHAVYLSKAGRTAIIGAYERRADELITHPRFGYRMSYRRIVELEARILAKWLMGEIDALAPLWTR